MQLMSNRLVIIISGKKEKKIRKSRIEILEIADFGLFMVFNATFSNISFISWQSVLLVEETGVPRENHRPVTSH
jgi:hypothetical protein